MLTALLVIGILVLLIVVHELGHFVAAKLSGVKVEEFGVGYPPRAFTLVKLGGTEYTLNWIPFGGFVRLFGDVGEGEHGRGSLVDAPRWKQALILVAGVAMNALTAWILFAVAFHIGVPQPIDAPMAGEETRIVIVDVVPGSPAFAAGLSAGDILVDMTDENGERAIDAWTPDAVVAFVGERAGEPIDVTFVHEGETKHATLIPAQGVLESEAGKPALGVALVLVASRSEPWGDALYDAYFATIDTFKNVFDSLAALVGRLTSGHPSLSGVVGPVGIVGYVHDASQNGFGAVLILAAIISVNLSIFNLIPIPALDGGRLLTLGVEAVLRRAAPRLITQALNALGVAFIILLMVVVTYQDILRLIA
ncbi:MAG: RIP metalloprotease [Patescibacteria group bacterium]|nr:RIP metalloprotease [Patescibacteria group bacterium]